MGFAFESTATRPNDGFRPQMHRRRSFLAIWTRSLLFVGLKLIALSEVREQIQHSIALS